MFFTNLVLMILCALAILQGHVKKCHELDTDFWYTNMCFMAVYIPGFF